MPDRHEWERERERASRGDWDRGRDWSDHGDPEYRGRDDWGREDYGRSAERYREHGDRADWGRQSVWGKENRENREPRSEWRSRADQGKYAEGWSGWLSASWERGRYAGRGPKNYVRSDERIWEDVNDRLTDHPQIDATEIEVNVKDGEVTLAGTVEDRRSKRLAEDLAESVSGVKEVYNQLRIQQAAGSTLARRA